MSQAQTARNDSRYEDYIPVSERIEQFYAKFPGGRINTFIIANNEETGFILMRAEVFRSQDDAQPASTGHAYEIKGDGYVNKTSHVENCETGAVGRALALLGFEVKRGIASREEMQKADRMPRTAESAMTPVRAVADNIGFDNPDAEEHDDLDGRIRQMFVAKGHTIDQLLPAIRKRFGVENGLKSLSLEQKRDMLEKLRSS